MVGKNISVIEITKSNSSFRNNHFKVSRITAKIYEIETGKKINKDKIISNNLRSSVRNHKPEICKITNDNRI